MARGMLEAPLTLAERVAVLPLWPAIPGQGCACVRAGRCDAPGKHPAGFLVPHGVTDATTDPATIRRWWARPELRTGRLWDLGAVVPVWAVVVDLDGREAAESLQPEGLSLPLTARTGRDGFHEEPTRAAQQSPKREGRRTSDRKECVSCLFLTRRNDRPAVQP